VTPERLRDAGRGVTPERLRRERTAAVLLALVAGLLGLLAASRTWAAADVTDALAGRLQLRLSGRQVAPIVPAVSVVLLAEVAVTTTGWPWLAVAAGVLSVLAGAVVVVAGRRWSAPSDRFESPGAGGAGAASAPGATARPGAAGRPGVAGGAGGGPDRAASGESTAPAPAVSARQGAHGRTHADTTETADASPTRAPSNGGADSSVGGPHEPVDPEPADAWDALSRGEDPTR